MDRPARRDQLPGALTDLRARILLARFARSPGERSGLLAGERRGDITRIQRGCYLDTALWESLDPAAQHRARAHVADLSLGDGLVFSHLTAAALWRLPILGSWPSRAHVAGAAGSGGHRYAAVARHTLGLPSVTAMVEGLVVTTLAVTTAQVSASEGFAVGVVVADAALRRGATMGVPVTNADLRAAAAAIPLTHGRARALAVADFADASSDRPGESISRVNMHAAGLPLPHLQVPLHGASGTRYWVDFYWRDQRHIGEFDGMAKHTDPEFLRGRTPERALADEKFREDDLRAANHGMSRWGWHTANSPALLSQLLRRAGIR